MNVNNYGKYNFADMLISIEEEMENHITALRTARKQIGLLWNDCDRMSDRICYLESILDMYNIDYSRDDFNHNIRGISYENPPVKNHFLYHKKFFEFKAVKNLRKFGGFKITNMHLSCTSAAPPQSSCHIRSARKGIWTGLCRA